MTLSSGPFVSDGAAAILQVLSAEKNDSLAKLEDEVLNLKDENIKLEQRIDELQTELENERRCRAGCMCADVKSIAGSSAAFSAPSVASYRSALRSLF